MEVQHYRAGICYLVPQVPGREPSRIGKSTRLSAACAGITAAVQLASLAMGAAAADGVLPLAYARAETTPA